MDFGELKVPLLTPTPQRITTNVITCREYVPVVENKFQIVQLQLFTNLSSMTLFDGAYNISVVLHFTPKYKRKGYKENDKDKKRHCCNCNKNGYSSGFLQQTANGGFA
jgi:hypothetical protein